MDQPPPYAPAPGPGFGSAPGFPGYQILTLTIIAFCSSFCFTSPGGAFTSYPAQPFYYQGSPVPGPPGPPGAPGGSWPYSPTQDMPKNTVYLMKPEERPSLPGFTSALSGLSPGFSHGLSPGFGHGFGGGLKSLLGACSAALCCCCLWDLLHR